MNLSNILELMASEVAHGPRTEAYLVVSDIIQFVTASAETKVQLEKLVTIAGCPASEVIARDFQRGCPISDPCFHDDCWGAFVCDGVVVELRVRRINTVDEAPVYRVLFSRIDAGKLLIDTQDRVKALENQVHQLVSQQAN